MDFQFFNVTFSTMLMLNRNYRSQFLIREGTGVLRKNHHLFQNHLQLSHKPQAGFETQAVMTGNKHLRLATSL